MFRKSDQLDVFSHFMYEQMVPATHKLRKFKAAVDLSMVDSLVYDSYSWNGKGAPGYDPTVLFQLLLLQRIYNLSLSQVLDRANTDAAFRWFIGINTSDELPCKATLSNFARLRMGNIKLRKIFRDVVIQARAKGMIKGTRVVVDGTIVAANTKLKAHGTVVVMTARRLLKRTGLWGSVQLPASTDLSERVAFARAVVEKLKDAELSPRQRRTADLLQAMLEGQGKPDKIATPIDPEARVAYRNRQQKLGYNAIIAMDADSEIITAVSFVPANHDEGSYLKEIFQSHVETTGIVPEQLFADSSYGHGENYRDLHSKGVDALIPKKSNGQRNLPFHKDKFILLDQENRLICPEGRVATNPVKFDGEGLKFTFDPADCGQCPKKKECTKGKARAVEFNRYHKEVAKAKLLLTRNRNHVLIRMAIEHKNSELKRRHGLDRLAGIGLVAGEFQALLSAIVTNIKRITVLSRMQWMACSS